MPVQTYLVDAYDRYAASALAANTVLRSLAGAFLPLAGPKMYKALGFFVFVVHIDISLNPSLLFSVTEC